MNTLRHCLTLSALSLRSSYVENYLLSLSEGEKLFLCEMMSSSERQYIVAVESEKLERSVSF